VCSEVEYICRNSDEVRNQDYIDCVAAANCAMTKSMVVAGAVDETTNFVHEMIPHHVNAVMMARTLLKFSPASLDCGVSYDDEHAPADDGDVEVCTYSENSPMRDMAWNIVNTQNAQITLMRDWIRDNAQVEHESCDDDDDDSDGDDDGGILRDGRGGDDDGAGMTTSGIAVAAIFGALLAVSLALNVYFACFTRREPVPNALAVPDNEKDPRKSVSSDGRETDTGGKSLQGTEEKVEIGWQADAALSRA